MMPSASLRLGVRVWVGGSAALSRGWRSPHRPPSPLSRAYPTAPLQPKLSRACRTLAKDQGPEPPPRVEPPPRPEPLPRTGELAHSCDPDLRRSPSACAGLPSALHRSLNPRTAWASKPLSTEAPANNNSSSRARCPGGHTTAGSGQYAHAERPGRDPGHKAALGRGIGALRPHVCVHTRVPGRTRGSRSRTPPA